MSHHFDWKTLLRDGVYSRFPEADSRPVIGITANYGEGAAKLNDGYYKAIVRAGGTPVIIPPCSDTDVIINTLDRLDGLVLSGGADYNPLYCGEEPQPRLGGINAERDLPELLITRLAYNRQLPILGICRGIQTLAMALDGKVSQHISATIKHSQDADRSVPTHSITITEGSLLSQLFNSSLSQLFNSSTSQLFVNSFHHQAVSDPGPHFRVSATAPDGIIEAIESNEHKSIIGVQWHPECLDADEGGPLFAWLVGEAAAYRKACDVHRRVVTLDTHCDTPMFFPQGIDFGRRDDRILVDLHKMAEGRQDATIMVAYLPQPTDRPTAYADSIFDQIEALVSRDSAHVAIARTPADLVANKGAGRHSIMLGIENGHALDGRLDNLDHFARRGIVYMTLCHNGDNDICDSARGSDTHHGVSAFGRDVIRRMNSLGIMVDLSHGAERSFYDALDISATPIVCSHSSCRALCDHPRNLTDDQMRALASRGGVMQVTAYPGFLVRDGEATVLDVLRHLDHAIDVMGIDHVGIGTDFDGDGGVPGLSCSSDMLLFTRLLLQHGYSEADIAKIWGGNFLRVMTLVQDSRTL